MGTTGQRAQLHSRSIGMRQSLGNAELGNAWPAMLVIDALPRRVGEILGNWQVDGSARRIGVANHKRAVTLGHLSHLELS